MIAKIKAYGVVILSIALAVMYALFNKEKAQRYRDKAKVAKGAADTLTKANKAISEADKRGRARLDETDTNRDHFS